MKEMLFLLILSFSSIRVLSQDTNSNTVIGKDVILWVEKFFINGGYFHDPGNPTKKLTSLTSKDIEGQYYIFLIEKQNFDSVTVSVFHIGLGYSHFIDKTLIAKTYVNKEAEFVLIDESTGLKELARLYEFFCRYNKFSTEAKVKCYERIIIDYSYE